MDGLEEPARLRRLKRRIEEGSIRGAVIDLDGTLYSGKAGVEFQIIPKMAEHTSRMLDVDLKTAKRLLLQYRRKYRSGVLGLRDHHGLDPHALYEAVYSDLDLAAVSPYPGLVSALTGFARSVPLSLLTNSAGSHARRLLRHLEIEEVFTTVIGVEDNDFIRKPHREVYENISRRLQLEPEAIIVVDDSFLNLWTASGMGMHTVLVSNGIADPPMFWEMHLRMQHPVPGFVDFAEFDISNALRQLVPTPIDVAHAD